MESTIVRAVDGNGVHKRCRLYSPEAPITCLLTRDVDMSFVLPSSGALEYSSETTGELLRRDVWGLITSEPSLPRRPTHVGSLARLYLVALMRVGLDRT